MSSDYVPLRCWCFKSKDNSVVVCESDKPDTVLVEGIPLTRAQFKALAKLADEFRSYGDYVRYAEAPEDEQETPK